MKLEIIEGEAREADGAGGRRILTPGAPPSPGPCPNDLAVHLQHGEVLVWWSEKTNVQLGLAGITLGAAAVAILLVTGFAPSFWSQPLSGLWKPVLALLSPTLLVLGREWASRTALMVTGNAIIEVPRRGAARRIALPQIRAVKRDWVRGGLRLEGPTAALHVPTSLVEDAGKAVRSRRRGRGGAPEGIDDPLRWLS